MKMIICTLIALLLGGILVSHEAEARFWWNGYNHCHYYHHGRQSDGHRTTEPASREVEVNLTVSVREVIDEVKPTHPGVEIVFDADDDLNGYWDFERLKQMISNFLINAIQHGGGNRIRVTAKAMTIPCFWKCIT